MNDHAKWANMVKLWFELNPELWHRCPVESMWAEPIAHTAQGGAYRLMNSPFYAYGVSFLDTVHATPNSDGALVFDRVIKHSGHSTYMMLVPPDSSSFDAYWKKLEELGCTYESGDQNTAMGKRILYSVDVPDTADLGAVIRILTEGEERGVWMYQEGHNGQKNA